MFEHTVGCPVQSLDRRFVGEKQLELIMIGLVVQPFVFGVSSGISGKLAPIREGPAHFDILLVEVEGLLISFGVADRVDVELQAVGQADLGFVLGFGGGVASVAWNTDDAPVLKL